MHGMYLFRTNQLRHPLPYSIFYEHSATLNIMTRLLFICHGNICRSPMAQSVMQHLVNTQNLSSQFIIDSRATSREEIGNAPHPGTVRQLASLNIPLIPHRATQLLPTDYDQWDYLIGMDSINMRNIMRIVKTDPEQKVSMLLDFTSHPRDIDDPWYTGNFSETYRDVREGCEALLAKLVKEKSV